jgi:hypothetical protein
MQHLVSAQAKPEVLFSPIRSQAAAIDRNPAGVLLWLDYRRPDGSVAPLPDASFVTSRNASAKGTRKAIHFGLFCYSESPLSAENIGTIRFAELRNLSTQKPVCFSQVTAVVDRAGISGGKRDLKYQVVLTARLLDPFFARLATPVVLENSDAQFVASVVASDDEGGWLPAVCSIKDRYPRDFDQNRFLQGSLFV